MKRTPMKRTEWRRKPPETPIQRAPTAIKLIVPAKVPARIARMDPINQADFRPMPKTEPHRNPCLLTMAMGEPCLLQVPDICINDFGTSVACHSNWGEHGKAGARKADDEYTVWGCTACHRWLDQGPADEGEKRMRFNLAHLRMVEVWREISGGRRCATKREMAAAQWALDRLNENDHENR